MKPYKRYVSQDWSFYLLLRHKYNQPDAEFSVKMWRINTFKFYLLECACYAWNDLTFWNCSFDLSIHCNLSSMSSAKESNRWTCFFSASLWRDYLGQKQRAGSDKGTAMFIVIYACFLQSLAWHQQSFIHFFSFVYLFIHLFLQEEKEKARAQKEEVVTQVTEVLENELQCIICSELFIEVRLRVCLIFDWTAFTQEYNRYKNIHECSNLLQLYGKKNL